MKLKHKLLTASILAFSTSSIIYSINQFIKYFATKSLKNNDKIEKIEIIDLDKEFLDKHKDILEKFNSVLDKG